MRFKQFALKFSVSLAAVLFILFCSEAFFRLMRGKDALNLSIGRRHTKYLTSLEPNTNLRLVSNAPGEYDVTAHINHHGFRGPDIAIEKLPGQKRIFLIGDSFTFGVGANDNETIPYFLQQALDPTMKKSEAVNLGHGHNSPIIHYLRLKDELPKFKPDLVVMLLDFSDLADDWNFERHAVFDEHHNLIALNPYYENGRFNLWNFLRSHSVFCLYLHNKVVRTFLKIQKLGLMGYLKARLEGKKAKAAIAATKEDTIAYDAKLLLRGSEKADEIKTHFPRTAKYILLAKEITEANGARFMLVLYPYGTHVGSDQWSKGRTAWGFEEGKLYTDLFSFKLVEEFAAAHRIPFINLLDTLRAHADQMLYFPYDGHFTPAANKIAAETLAPRIASELSPLNHFPVAEEAAG